MSEDQSNPRADSGKVYLVGAGPGDPGLLTLKGLRALTEADLVLYDGLVNPLILRHTHASAERTGRALDSGRRTLNQAEINRRLIEAARQGKTVVRLKGGDPFIFGRGSEEAEALAAEGIPFEVVPGITAATAAAEYAGISLTHRASASAVAFVTGHEDPEKSESTIDYAVLGRFPGTLVFYMGLHRIGVIARKLIEHGRVDTDPVAVISHATRARQRTVTGTLADVAERVAAANLHAPSLIIVGECVSQRSRINWYEALPLAGLTIGITRPEVQAMNTIEHALTLGAEPLLMPTIEIHPVDDFRLVDDKLKCIDTYDWLVFTSANGVESFLNRLWELGGDARGFGEVKIAAIGSATAERLADYRLWADLVPKIFRAEALAEELRPHVSGRRVLWPRANRGRDVLPEELTAAGADFEEVVVYEHRDVDQFSSHVMTALERDELDWIGLGSPSIAENIARLLGPQLADLSVRFAAISPVTEQAATAAGLTVTAVAGDHTWAGIFDAIQQSGR